MAGWDTDHTHLRRGAGKMNQVSQLAHRPAAEKRLLRSGVNAVDLYDRAMAFYNQLASVHRDAGR